MCCVFLSRLSCVIVGVNGINYGFLFEFIQCQIGDLIYHFQSEFTLSFVRKLKRRKIVYSAFHTIRLISIFGSYYDIYEMTKFPFLGKPREAHKTLKWIFASTDIEKVGESKKCTTMTSAETSKIPFDILYVFFAH